MFGKNKVAALVAEFLGTGVLTLLILTVQRSTIGVPFFVAMAAGLTMLLMSFVLGGVSGGYFNPALTLGLWTARKLSTMTTFVYVVVQMLGGFAALGLYTYFINSHVQSVGGHYSGRILVAEAVGTGLFSFGFAATVYQGFGRAANAAYAGAAYMIGIIAASSAAIGLLNPAVALGARAFVWGTYVLGPVVGAIIGINLYGMLFAQPEAASTASAAAVVSSPSSSASSAKKKTSAKKKSSAKK